MSKIPPKEIELRSSQPPADDGKNHTPVDEAGHDSDIYEDETSETSAESDSGSPGGDEAGSGSAEDQSSPSGDGDSHQTSGDSAGSAPTTPLPGLFAPGTSWADEDEDDDEVYKTPQTPRTFTFDMPPPLRGSNLGSDKVSDVVGQEPAEALLHCHICDAEGYPSKHKPTVGCPLIPLNDYCGKCEKIHRYNRGCACYKQQRSREDRENDRSRPPTPLQQHVSRVDDEETEIDGSESSSEFEINPGAAAEEDGSDASSESETKHVIQRRHSFDERLIEGSEQTRRARRTRSSPDLRELENLCSRPVTDPTLLLAARLRGARSYYQEEWRQYMQWTGDDLEGTDTVEDAKAVLDRERNEHRKLEDEHDSLRRKLSAKEKRTNEYFQFLSFRYGRSITGYDDINDKLIPDPDPENEDARNTLHFQVVNVKKSLEKELESKKQTQKQLFGMQAQLSKAEGDCRLANNHIQKLNKDIDDLEDETREMKDECRMRSQDFSDLDQEHAQLKNDHERLENNHARLENVYERLQQEHERVLRSYKSVRQRSDDADTAERSPKGQSCNEGATGHQAKIDALTAQVDGLKTSKGELQQRLSDGEAALQLYDEEVEAHAVAPPCDEAVTGHQAEIDDLKARNGRLLAELERLLQQKGLPTSNASPEKSAKRSSSARVDRTTEYYQSRLHFWRTCSTDEGEQQVVEIISNTSVVLDRLYGSIVQNHIFSLRVALGSKQTEHVCTSCEVLLPYAQTVDNAVRWEKEDARLRFKGMMRVERQNDQSTRDVEGMQWTGGVGMRDSNDLPPSVTQQYELKQDPNKAQDTKQSLPKAQETKQDRLKTQEAQDEAIARREQDKWNKQERDRLKKGDKSNFEDDEVAGEGETDEQFAARLAGQESETGPINIYGTDQNDAGGPSRSVKTWAARGENNHLAGRKVDHLRRGQYQKGELDAVRARGRAWSF